MLSLRLSLGMDMGAWEGPHGLRYMGCTWGKKKKTGMAWHGMAWRRRFLFHVLVLSIGFFLLFLIGLFIMVGLLFFSGGRFGPETQIQRRREEGRRSKRLEELNLLERAFFRLFTPGHAMNGSLYFIFCSPGNGHLGGWLGTAGWLCHAMILGTGFWAGSLRVVLLLFVSLYPTSQRPTCFLLLLLLLLTSCPYSLHLPFLSAATTAPAVITA